MSISIVKEIIPFFVTPFNYMYDLSFHSCVFHNAVKFYEDMLAHKNGAKNESCNYRPISLLPDFSKIFEKLFDLKIEKCLKKHSILHECEFDLRSGRSTCINVLILIENETSLLGAHIHAVSAFIDKKKAFHAIDQNT